MNDIITVDFSQFGARELYTASQLLSLLAEKGVPFLGNGVTVNFNPYSDCVFLSDEDFNVGVLDDSNSHIIQLYNCFECGFEGTQAQALEEGKDFEKNEGYCSPECLGRNG